MAPAKHGIPKPTCQCPSGTRLTGLVQEAPQELVTHGRAGEGDDVNVQLQRARQPHDLGVPFQGLEAFPTFCVKVDITFDSNTTTDSRVQTCSQLQPSEIALASKITCFDNPIVQP